MYIDFEVLGKRISKRRRELGYKQCELAEKTGLSNNYLSNVERGRSTPSLATLASICKGLNVTPDYFLLGTMKTNDVPYHIIESMSLCSEDDLCIIEGMIELLINRKSDNEALFLSP